MTQLVRRNTLDFGKIDAKSSMTSRDLRARKLFMDAFAIPPSFDRQAFVSGDRYLVYGTKGSGKTALLRFMMEEEKKKGSLTKFIVFDEDITQQEITAISSDLDTELFDTPDIENLIEVRDMWTLFLIRSVCDLMLSHKSYINDASKIAKIKEIIDVAIGGGGKTTISRIIALIKSGTLRFKIGNSEFAELEAQLNLERQEGGDINLGRFTEIVIDVLCKHQFPEDIKYCIYVDELNLSMLEKKQHKKDSILIRDMVQSIGYLNRVLSERGIPIYLYAGVRIEVAKAINVSRNEIDKFLIDHGQKIEWHSGLDVTRYPIFSIIEQRIIALEMDSTGKCNKPEDIWESYFANDLFGVRCKQFISEITWCNPRDIVNLFNLASKAMISRPRYDTEVFAAISSEYSERVWSERAEELNAEHSMTVVNAIRRLLSQGYRHFKIETLTKRAETLSHADQTLAQVCSTVGIEKICRDLYHVGVVGQSLPQRHNKESGKPSSIVQTWFYRDNVEFDSSQWIIVHPGLFPVLKLATNWNASMFGLDPRTT